MAAGAELFRGPAAARGVVRAAVTHLRNSADRIDACAFLMNAIPAAATPLLKQWQDELRREPSMGDIEFRHDDTAYAGGIGNDHYYGGNHYAGDAATSSMIMTRTRRQRERLGKTQSSASKLRGQGFSSVVIARSTAA